MNVSTVSLRHVAHVQVSNVDKKSIDGEQTVELCNYTDVYYQTEITRDLEFMRATATAQQIRNFGLRAGDVIITKDSETAADIGVAAYVPKTLPGVVCGYHLALIRPQPNINSRFLFWAVQSDAVREQWAVSASGVTRFGLNYDAMRSTEIPLPPVEEQRRIANYLDDQTTRIDQTIQLRQQQMNLTEARLQAKVQEAVTGTAVPGERTGNALPWVDSIPAGWGTPRISQVARMGTGHTPSRSESAYWVDCKIPWLTTSDVHRFRHDEIDFIETTTVQISQLGVENSAAVVHPAGTVALSRTASAGFSIIMATDMATSQDFVTWTCGSQVNPEFLLWCLRAMRADMLGRLATGSTHKTIYFPDLMAIRMPLAPMEYQSHAVAGIRAAADATRTARTSLNLAIQLLQERKRALITATVTGELDVSSASSRAADAVVSGVGVGL